MASVEGVVLTVYCDTFLVLPAKVLQLLIGILGRIDTHDDRHSRMATVQSADAALERVVQPTPENLVCSSKDND